MGQAGERSGASAKDGDAGAQETRTPASLVARFKAAQQERIVALPTIGDVTMRPITRDEHAALPIDEDSDPESDQMHIVAATIIDPVFTAAEWEQVRDAATLGVWGAIVQAVWEVNGLDQKFLRDAGRRFREGA